MTEDIVKKMQEYLATATEEQLAKDYEELVNNHNGPTVNEYFNPIRTVETANQFPIIFNINDKDYQEFKEMQSATLVRDPYKVRQELELVPIPKVCKSCHLRNTGYPLCWNEAREWEYSTNCHFQDPFELDNHIVDE